MCSNCNCENPLKKDLSNSISNAEEENKDDILFCGRRVRTPSGNILVWSKKEGFSIKDYKLFYVGEESITLTNLMITYNQSTVSYVDGESNLE